MSESNKFRGYVAGAIAAAAYGTIPLFTLPLYADGMDPISALLWRYIIAIPLVMTMLHFRGRSMKLDSARHLMPIVILGVIMGISSLTLFLSYTYMPAGIASTILFVYPLLVAIIMSAFFREKTKLSTIVCILMAFVGIMLLYKAEDGTTLNLVGTILILLSAVSYAVYIVGINKTVLNSIPTLVVTLYVVIVITVFFFVYALLTGGVKTPNHWYLWFNVLALAVFPTLISFSCTTYAIQSIGSTPTAILGALEPATAIVIGLLVFDETMTPRILLGLVLIIVSVLFVIATPEISVALNRFKKLFPSLRKKK